MGVCEQERMTQHQCATCGECRPHHNCVVRWPGSVHDARILRESRFYRNLQQNPPDGIILGDSAYPLLPWLMTPFSMPNNAAEEGFNCAHGRTRSTIDCLNGVLKRCFACLNHLRVDPDRACNIILACICTTQHR